MKSADNKLKQVMAAAEKVGSRYLLCNLLARRTRHLMAVSRDNPDAATALRKKNPIMVALEEMATQPVKIVQIAGEGGEGTAAA